jgi:hypothetical protein
MFFAAVNKHADADGNTATFLHGAYRLSHGAPCGQNIIDDKDVLAGRDLKIASEHSQPGLFLGKDAPDSHLPGGLEGENDAAGGRPGDYICFFILEVSSD